MVLGADRGAGSRVKHRRQAIRDLEALGIDSAELRLDAALGHIHKHEEQMRKALRRLFLMAEFYDLAEQNAHQRCGPDPWADLFLDAYLGLPEYRPPLILIDYLTARDKILARYTSAIRQRAEALLDMLPQIRASK